MGRQVGFAANTYLSFETNEPKYLTSGIDRIVPPAAELPTEAFDEKGIMKEEYISKEPYAAYPEKHSVWDKVAVPNGDMSLGEFRTWLSDVHKVTLKNWNFVLGWRRGENDEGKEMKIPFSTQIYPPPV